MLGRTNRQPVLDSFLESFRRGEITGLISAHFPECAEFACLGANLGEALESRSRDLRAGANQQGPPEHLQGMLCGQLGIPDAFLYAP